MRFTFFTGTPRLPAKKYMPVMAAIVLVAGCTDASLVTSKLPDGATFVDSTEAIAYALPRGQLKLNIKWDGKADFPTVKLLGTEYSPDQSDRYVLRTEHSVLANDKFVLEAKNGLLSSINVENEDKTVSVVTQAAEVAKSVFAPAAAPGAKGRRSLKPFDRTILVDPFNVGALAAALNKIHLTASATDTTGGTLTSSPSGADCTANGNSLCYRVPLAVQLTITGLNGPGKAFSGFSHTVQGQVADLSTTYGYDVKRAACTKKVTALTFTSGMLTKVDVNEPSEILGCLTAIPDLIEKILPLPWGD